ncbi:MAG: hypothetical protein ACU84J_15030, partial [Gammaproteobacteria bacterium]
MRDANPHTVYLKDYTVPDYLIHDVDLHFILDEERTLVEAKLTLSRNPDCTAETRSLEFAGEN